MILTLLVILLQGISSFEITQCTSQICELSNVDFVIDEAYPNSNAVSINGNAITLYNFGSPRVYLVKHNNYEIISLLGKQIQFDIDVSNLPCGTNGAFYVSEMSQATPGTGYCDAQGGSAGCNEFDIFEGNSIANAFTTHSCADQSCDKSGCGVNTRNVGLPVDTSKPFTVITQFIESNAQLTEVHRQYQQNNQTYEGSSLYSCESSGGFTAMQRSLASGMVLVISIWGNTNIDMEWLDGCKQSSYDANAIVNAQVTFSNIIISDIGGTYISSSDGASSGSAEFMAGTVDAATPTSTASAVDIHIYNENGVLHVNCSAT